MTGLTETNLNTTTAIDPVLSKEQVMEVTALPLSSLYTKIQEGEFTEPVMLSKKRRGWLQSRWSLGSVIYPAPLRQRWCDEPMDTLL